MSGDTPQLGPSKGRRRRKMQEAFIDQDAEAAKPVKMFNIRMDAELHKWLKDYAHREELSMKEVVEGLIRDFRDTQES